MSQGVKMLSTLFFDYLISQTTFELCFILFAFSVPCFVFYKHYFEGVVPSGVPWAGFEDATFFSQLRSTILAMSRLREMLLLEYAKDRPFLISTFMNGPTVVLPRDHLIWYKTQNVKGTIDFRLLQAEKLHMEYFSVIDTNVDFKQYLNLVHRLLSRNWTDAVPEVHDEVKRGLDLLLGDDVTEWKDILCYDTIEKLISASANRMVIGSPLCQDEAYLAAARKCAKLMFPLGVIIQSIPTILRPIVGQLEKAYLNYHWKFLAQHVSSTAKQLLKDEDMSRNDSLKNTLIARYAQEAQYVPGRAELLSVSSMQNLVGIVNVAALSATTINCTDILLNILSYEGSKVLIGQLREEATRVFSSGRGYTGLDSMPLMDSVCRESLRLENGDMFFIEGLVTRPLTTPRGLLLPSGTRVALPQYCIHRDPEIYSGDPMEFYPYRFCDGDPGDQSPSYSVSENYLPFSFGPRACPGRWFAIAQIKIVLSRLLMDYDIKPLVSKPKSHRFGGYSIPSMSAKLRIRRREPVE